MPAKIGASAAPVVKSSSTPQATAARVDDNGNVFAKINGKEQKIASNAVDAWVGGEGRYVLFSGRDGAGGFENEGMSLRAFDTTTGKTKLVMQETVMITDVVSVKSGDKTALIVKMQDGGLGGEHRALVDPTRGQVYRSPLSTLLAKGDVVTVKKYDESAFFEPGSLKNAKPIKTETLSLKEMLSRPVIVNKNPFAEKGWGPR